MYPEKPLVCGIHIDIYSLQKFTPRSKRGGGLRNSGRVWSITQTQNNETCTFPQIVNCTYMTLLLLNPTDNNML